MPTLAAIADEIAAYRERLQAELDARVRELKAAHGSGVVQRALTVAMERAGLRASISISASRERQRRQRAAERGRAQGFREQHNDDEASTPLPPAWR
jgi:hypothetical protein